jgi:hypothetical protein
MALVLCSGKNAQGNALRANQNPHEAKAQFAVTGRMMRSRLGYVRGYNFEKRRTVNPMLLGNQIWNLIPKRLLIARPETRKIAILIQSLEWSWMHAPCPTGR